MSGGILDSAIRREAERVRRDAERQLRDLLPRTRLRPARPYLSGGVITSPRPIPLDSRPPSFEVVVVPARWDYTPRGVTVADVLAETCARLIDAGYPPDRAASIVDSLVCPAAVEVTTLRSAAPSYVCGCGQGCYGPPPPVCICGDSGTHRPEPGIGCTRPGCLCLEPTEPAP